MNAKSLAFGTVAGTIVMLIVGYVLYGPLLEGFYAANTNASLMKTEPNMLMMTLSTVVYAFFLSFVFSKWAGIKTIKAGAMAGAFIGLCIGLYVDLSLVSMINGMAGILAVVDPLVSAVWSACGGAVIGFVLAKT